MSHIVVGLTLDYELGGGFSKYPWYAVREHYFDSLITAGAVPMGLCHDAGLVEAYLDHVDGIVISGGDSDVDPKYYGAATCHPKTHIKPKRCHFELTIARLALERDLPILGICGGAQILAVALGGTLIQHIPDECPSDINHEQPNPRHEAGHIAIVAKETQLYKIVQQEEIGINSAHHQAVAEVPAIISARAPDGVIEAFEDPKYTFCMGVQWHPELTVSPADQKICKAFVEACRHRKTSRNV